MIRTRVHLMHPFLREPLREVPGMEVEWVRQDTGGRSEVVFWADGGDFEAFETALEGDPIVELLRSVPVGDQRLYQVLLTEEGERKNLYPVLVETVSLVLAARGTHEGWFCDFVFADQSALDRYFEACRERDIDFEITAMHDWEESKTPGVGLTDLQRETLLTAADIGYFDVPRESDLGELGERLGISDTAASQRLRRGMKTLVDQTIRQRPQS